jgi:hypothetical protein
MEDKKDIFKSGDKVYHIENPDLTMTVTRILKEKCKKFSGFNDKNERVLVDGTRIIGIECHWWQIDQFNPPLKTLIVHKFHSRELRKKV